MNTGIVMDSVNSIHFLWYAYVLVGAAQLAFVFWLVKSWSDLNKSQRNKR